MAQASSGLTQKLWDFCKFCLVYSQALLLVLGVLFFYSDSNPAWLGEVVGGHIIVVAAGSLLGIWWLAASRQRSRTIVPPPAPAYVRSRDRVRSAA